MGGQLAQLGERMSYTHDVAGSSPALPTIKKKQDFSLSKASGQVRYGTLSKIIHMLWLRY